MSVREFALGLDVNLPLAPEAVEIVDEAAAEEGLQRLVGPPLMADPCLSTLSRSTSMNICGTTGRKVDVTLASSGRLRAASRNGSSARRGSRCPCRRDPAG